MGSWGSETSLSIIDVNGQELAFIAGGSEVAYTNDLCLSAANSYTAILMDSYGDGWNGATFSVSTCEGSLVAVEGALLAGSVDSMVFAIQSCDSYSFGCMDSIASNYSADANEEDGSCVLDGACDSGLVGMIISMEDSFGDGWNGNIYSIINSAGEEVAIGGLPSDGYTITPEGTSGYDAHCLAADCYAISVAGGTYISEVSWSISTEYNGASIANAGGEDVAAFGLGSDGDCSSLLGCNDSFASNYNEAAIANDGSCEYITSLTCEEAIAIDANSTR